MPSWVWLAVGATALGLGGAYLYKVTAGQGCWPGQVPIQLVAQGPGQVCAGATCVHSGTVLTCPWHGASVQYQARADSLHNFRYFDGPGGIETTANPFSADSDTSGWVRANFE